MNADSSANNSTRCFTALAHENTDKNNFFTGRIPALEAPASANFFIVGRMRFDARHYEPLTRQGQEFKTSARQ
jgi:hypothetical protein